MNAHQQEEFKKLLNQFSIFQRQVDEKLNLVITDTESSVIAALLATKKIATLIKTYQTTIIDHSHAACNPAADHDVFDQVALQHANILEIILEMQSNFQFHDIVRQSIERMQDAMSKCDDIIQSLEFAVDSNEELNSLVRKMTDINHEYQALENRHAKLSSEVASSIEFF